MRYTNSDPTDSVAPLFYGFWWIRGGGRDICFDCNWMHAHHPDRRTKLLSRCWQADSRSLKQFRTNISSAYLSNLHNKTFQSVCYAVKAVHLELVSDFSSFYRFIARRNDQGSNFIEKNNLLHKLAEKTYSKFTVLWDFNLPSAPHFYGLSKARQIARSNVDI